MKSGFDAIKRSLSSGLFLFAVRASHLAHIFMRATPSLALIVLAAIGSQAHAEIVAFDIEARVTALESPSPPGLAVDDVFSLRLQYDTSLPGGGFFTADGAALVDNFIEVDFGNGSTFQTLDQTPDPDFLGVVANDAASSNSSGITDDIVFIAQGPTNPFLFGDGNGGPAAGELSTLVVILSDSTGAALDSGALPTSLLLDDFDSAIIILTTASTDNSAVDAVSAVVVSITQVPEPNAFLLALVAFGGQLCRRGSRVA